VPVFIDEDDDVPSYLEALRRLRSRGLSIRITLSSRSDEDFARRVHAAFEDDPRAEVHDAEPIGFEDRGEFRISNEPIALLTQRRSNLSRFLFRRGEFYQSDSQGLERADFYLFRGEESNAHGLMRSWLGRREAERHRPSTPRIGGVTEPLVSIVVPIYDRTVEILRMAHSIYLQDYPWIEVVFASNGSPPETIEAMRAAENYLMKRRFQVRTIELAQPCGSATIPRDLGIRASSGEMICVLDSDDWLSPGFFAFLRGGGWREDTLYYPKKIFRDHGRTMQDDFPFERPLPGLGTVESPKFMAALQGTGNFLCNSGVCCPRELFERSGGIDHRLTYGEDFYLWWRCARAGGRAELHDGSVNISLHPGNNELVVGDDSRLAEAQELAKRQEMTRWL
jgi:Glycosyl transferase family 2